jgi:hypothetical protein
VVINQCLDFGKRLPDFRVAQHTGFDSGYSGHRTHADAVVAELAPEANFLSVQLVRKRDGLSGFVSQAEEMAYRFPHGPMRR